MPAIANPFADTLMQGRSDMEVSVAVSWLVVSSCLFIIYIDLPTHLDHMVQMHTNASGTHFSHLVQASSQRAGEVFGATCRNRDVKGSRSRALTCESCVRKRIL